MSGDVIYPKASAPATQAALSAANERAERWRLRAVAAEAKVARVGALVETSTFLGAPGVMESPTRETCTFVLLGMDDIRAALTGEDR